MVAANLGQVMSQLNSDKIKQRQEGRADLELALSKHRAVENLETDTWLKLFTSLFASLYKEKEAWVKATKAQNSGKSVTSSNAAAARLEQASGSVRWLANRAIPVMKPKVLKEILAHVRGALIYTNKQLLQPIALNYIAILQSIVKWKPHLDHISEDMWIDLVELSLNYILGDPLRQAFDAETDAVEQAVSENQDIEEYATSDTDTASKKRKRTPNANNNPKQSSNPGSQRPRSGTITDEQILFTSLLATLLSSPHAPIVSFSYPYMSASILNRLQRFLVLYPTDTTLHHDYVIALSATLSHLSLNKRGLVEEFARNSWDTLVSLWGTKNKQLKQGLVIVLRTLLPFVVLPGHTFNWSSGVARLWKLLGADTESRWGGSGLSLDFLRLEADLNPNDNPSAFRSSTFRAGYQFDSEQALAWAILELQADCAEKLFQFTESVHHSSATQGSSTGTSRSEKRARLENPITTLLSSIQQSPVNIRAQILQTLLFIIERHWLVFHHALRQSVVSTLSQFISSDNANIQSWVFMCFAAIAFADAHGPEEGDSMIDPVGEENAWLSPTVRDAPSTSWDTIWTHALRRANVSRAASHAANIILYYSNSHSTGRKLLVPQHRVLIEIESFAKELDVQGPVQPSDTVCLFLTRCLEVASQDARLHRMKLEDKVISWLVDTWRFDSGKAIPHLISDVMALLESACGFKKHSDLVCRLQLPECSIVAALVEEKRASVILNFLLDAKLPPFRNITGEMSKGTTIHSPPSPTNEADLAPPRACERKISTFMLKSTESLINYYEASQKAPGAQHATAERVRASLDLAVATLSFEAVLVLNDTRFNRRAIQSACKLISLATSLLTEQKWTVDEKTMILLGIEPLVSTGEEEQTEAEKTWEAMVSPNIGTGIKTAVLHALSDHRETVFQRKKLARQTLQRIIWRSADVQDTFATILLTIKDIIRMTAGATPTAVSAMDIDADDQFEPIRTTQASSATQVVNNDISPKVIIEVCMAFVIVAPILQSNSGAPTRDKDLTEIILACGNEQRHEFMLLSRIFFSHIRQGTLDVGVKSLEAFFDVLQDWLTQINYRKDELLYLLVIHALDCTMHIWLQPVVSTTTSGEGQKAMCEWLSQELKKHGLYSWRVRDALASFLDRYLLHDPSEIAWSDDRETRHKRLPSSLLPFLGSDQDIRVRFRASAANARLFRVCWFTQLSPDDLYLKIKSYYTTVTTDYEAVLTRMLSLANIIIASAAVRRGPYWHLLETALHDSQYCPHVETLLLEVSTRMGLSNFSELFETYSAQFALSVQKSTKDFFSIPPHLLGYKTRKECAEATFHRFTPTNIVSNDLEKGGLGERAFQKQCATLGKTFEEGIEECFGDIVGLFLVAMFEDPQLDHSVIVPTLATATSHQDFEQLHAMVSTHADMVISALLRTVGEQDVSANSTILQAMAVINEGAASDFLVMAKYRSASNFQTHPPNLPLHNPAAILGSLSWLLGYAPDSQSSATVYHVLHQLLADVNKTPLVNEQLRLVNAITMWISLRASSFTTTERPLLHTIIHGMTTLLSQADLYHAAQGILEWVFDRYIKNPITDVHFPNMLVRIACIIYDYSASSITMMTEIGRDLAAWLDTQAIKLSQVHKSGRLVAKALSVWPYDTSDDLKSTCLHLSLDTPSDILRDAKITCNKFRLVQRLRDNAKDGKYDTTNYFSDDFWRLKEYIPPPEQLQPADIDAFVDLLILSHGRLRGAGQDQPDVCSIRYLEINPPKKAVCERDGSVVRFLLVWCIHAMLGSNDAWQVHVAYQTLRLIFSAAPGPNQVITELEHWPPEIAVEVIFFQSYPCTAKIRGTRTLDELTSSDVFLVAAADFSRWISMMSNLICDILSTEHPVFAQLTLLLDSQTKFAEQVLPVLIHDLLKRYIAVDNNSIDTPARRTLRNYFVMVLQSSDSSTAARRCIIDVVLHLRHFFPDKDFLPRDKDILNRDKWIFFESSDFQLLASNALAYGAYTTALLFVELAAGYRQGSPNLKDSSLTEQILLQIYSHIDEPDGFYGIETTDMHQFLIKRLHHENQWEKAFQFHGAAFEAGNMGHMEAEGLLHSFHSFGFHNLAIDSLQNSAMRSGTSLDTSGMTYHLGWRTQQWDLPDQSTASSSGASLYRAIRAVHRERDSFAVDTAVRHALNEEICRFRSLGGENIREMKESARSLMCLSQVSQWRNKDTQSRLSAKVEEGQTWDYLSCIDSHFDFSDLEHIMATRVSLLQSARQKEERSQIGTVRNPFMCALVDAEKQCLVRLSEAAREDQHVQIALNSVVRAQRLEMTPSFVVTQEFAHVLSLQNEHKMATQFLSSLVAKAENPTQPASKIGAVEMALLLSRLGTWTSAARLEKPTVIFSTYFNRAAQLAEVVQSNLPQNADFRRATVYHQCAVFAERQYQATMLQNVEVSRWRIYAERKAQEVRDCDAIIARSHVASSSVKKDRARAQTELDADMAKINRHDQAQTTFLGQAIEMYSRCLASSDAFDDDNPIRLCSLWFSNFDVPALQDTIHLALSRVPSSKFVFLAHQLSARMCGARQLDKSQTNLHELVFRMCREHPFHSLYQVYCLKPQGPAPQANRRQSGRHVSSQSEREEAAGDIFQRMRNDPQNADRVREVELVCDASLEWAKEPIKKYVDGFKIKSPGQPFPIVPKCTILKIAHTKVPVMTMHLPIDKTLLYDNCVCIDGFEKTFVTAGGINIPKINICTGSDGKPYKQLFKGEGHDDLRQDAVMEQVFDVVNHILRHDRETSRRSLKVHDYKVIPLAAQAGVLEFVADTIPLGDWIQKAHARYGKNDAPPSQIHNEHKQKSMECKNNSEIMSAFLLKLREKFHPVMRHYFTEKSKIPIVWYTMRLGYTRSVATNSIVGHILGLGDRHPGNILMHLQTGEVINIDLGIAFDQGKLLAVPERVPFRMTKDMVDGMGISGTQGVFQRCAEQCLRVLRDRSEVIMTVLEVFKYDPLHSWTASDTKVKKIQPPSSLPSGDPVASMTNAQEAAERALNSVALKLDKSLSVEYTVNDLVAQATDPLNLGTIYSGWGPHL